jgi:hypothetical protein
MAVLGRVSIQLMMWALGTDRRLAGPIKSSFQYMLYFFIMVPPSAFINDLSLKICPFLEPFDSHSWFII